MAIHKRLGMGYNKPIASQSEIEMKERWGIVYEV
jgi:hypothetical protein